MSACPSAGQKLHWLYMLPGIIVGVFFHYLTTRNVDPSEAIDTIAVVDPVWMPPLTLAYLINLAFRYVHRQLLFP